MSGIDKADPKSSGTYRAALAAVIILSVLLVLAVIAVVAGFARQYQIHRAGPAAAQALSGAVASITLAPGARILSATTDSGKLVLHVQTPSGGEIEILDLASGKLTGQVKESGR